MPSRANPHAQDPDVQGSQDNLFLDAREDHVQANPEGDLPLPRQSVDDVLAMFKKKVANVKRRVTITTNVLVPLERDDIPLHMDDIESARKHLRQSDNALEVLNALVDDELDADDNALQPFVKQAEDFVPQIMDLRARINRVQSKIPSNNEVLQPTPNTPTSTVMHKIDHTFRPEPLDKSATPAIFQQWKEQFQVYASRNNFSKAPFKDQRILLAKCLTPAMYGNLKRICTSTNVSSLDQLLGEVEKYISKSNNLMMQRYRYFNCVQLPGESYEDYITRFRDIGDYADFDSFSYDSNMACRLITGILDEDLRTHLLRLPNPTFQAVEDFTLSWHISKSNSTEVTTANHASAPNNLAVNKVSTYKSNKRSSFHKNVSSNASSGAQSRQPVSSTSHSHRDSRSKSQSAKSSVCGRCGFPPHANGRCPASNQECTLCNGMGHFRRMCKSAKSRRGQSHVNHVEEEEDDAIGDQSCASSDFNTTEQDHVNIVDCPVFQVDFKPHPTPRIPAIFSFRQSQQSGHVLPDTGAAVSVVPSALLRSWGWHHHITKTDNVLRSAGGEELACDGTICVDVALYGDPKPVSFYVCPNVKSVLLSWVALKDLDVVSKHFPGPVNISQVLHFDSEIEQYKRSLLKMFPEVFNQNNNLAPMRGDPMLIHLRNNIDWSNITPTFKPRPIPIPLRQAAKSEIDAMIAKNIIIPVTKPTPFVSPLLVVPKKGGSVRLVIDYTELNKYIRRPVHPFPSVNEVKALIPTTSKYFATMDALQGYWQVPLDPSSQELTTFLTPWGRYCFTRAPMGLASSGDEYCRRGDFALQGIQNVIKVVDDVLLHAPTLEDLKITIQQVLRAAQSHGISLSPDKFNIGPSVSFVGLNITAAGIRPDPRHLQALSEFPRPKNKTDLRSFFGLLNQFATFSKDITQKSKPLRPLLSNQSDWQWTQDHENSFIDLRNLLTQSPIMRYFSPGLETKLLTDASRLNGLGYVLLQKHTDGWAMVSCGSRMISPTESNYAVCELEALAIVWSIQKCRIYLMGLPTFTVVTDHRPLVTIFNSSRMIRNDNPRLLRLMQKVAVYTFQVTWMPGRAHSIPDALSRAPLPVCVIDAQQSPHIVEPNVYIEDPGLARISAEAKTCSKYQDLFHAVSTMSRHDMNSLPSQTHGHVKAFSSIWDRLSCDSRSHLVLLDCSKIVVPQCSRPRLLTLAHASHQGISRTKARLQALYFWHGMGNDVSQLVQACNLCQKFRPSQPSNPLQDPQVPQYPFEKVSCDLFDYQGSFTLVYVDRFTGWPLVAHYQKSPSSAQLIKVLSNFFKDFGIPTAFRHDGARPFTSQEFSSFLKSYQIKDELSAAYNPQSNGHAEAAVKAIKLLVKKSWLTRQLDLAKFNMALLEWRSTPRLPGGKSPAELLFHRKLRTLLPAFNYNSVSPNDVISAVNKNYNALKHAYHQLNFRKKALPLLHPGDRVIIRNPNNSTWDKRGTIQSVRAHGHSYFVLSQGKVFLRTRRHLKKVTHL